MSLSPLLSVLFFVFSLCFFAVFLHAELTLQTLFPFFFFFFALYSRGICVTSKLQRANSFCLVIVCWWYMKQTEDNLNFHKFNWACRHKERKRQNPSQCDTVSWRPRVQAACVASGCQGGEGLCPSQHCFYMKEEFWSNKQTLHALLFFRVQESSQFLMNLGPVLSSFTCCLTWISGLRWALSPFPVPGPLTKCRLSWV